MTAGINVRHLKEKGKRNDNRVNRYKKNEVDGWLTFELARNEN